MGGHYFFDGRGATIAAIAVDIDRVPLPSNHVAGACIMPCWMSWASVHPLPIKSA